MREKLNLRLAVVGTSGARSSVWRIWSNKNDIYAASRGLAHVEKFSFHASGICRHAFTKQYGTPSTLTDRAMAKWRRAPTPPAGGSQTSQVLSVAFPSDFLSSDLDEEPKPFTRIDAAPAGMATVVTLLFCRDKPAKIRDARAVADTQIHSIFALSTGEQFVVASGFIDWEHQDFWMPASHGQPMDFIFASADSSGRPLRITMLSNPKDGDCLFCKEIGGHKETPSASRTLQHKFTRNQIIASHHSR